jgi:hypothetical protein
MSGARSAFSEINFGVRGSVKFGDSSVMEIEGRGTILFLRKSGEHRRLSEVYYIPKLRANIISLGQMEEGGCTIVLKHRALCILDESDQLLTMVHRSTNRLYVLELKVEQPVCLSAKTEEASWRWHARYGHLNFPALQKLSNGEMVRGLSAIEGISKQKRNSFPSQASYRATKHLELVHGDLCGPIKLETPGGCMMFLLLVDDMSRFMWLKLLHAKSDAVEAIKLVQAQAEAESGRRLRVLRTDHGGEFTSNTFKEYCDSLRVQGHLTVPYSPQQNGVVEHRNQTIVGTARSMMKTAEMPGKFWGEAVTTAVYLLNRSLTSSLEGRTSYEAWHGNKPAIHHLHTFGCVVYTKVTRPHLAKFDDRGRKGVFIGYEAGSKAYRVYDPVEGRVIVSRDIVFNENTF